jgi:hypothetical protein
MMWRARMVLAVVAAAVLAGCGSDAPTGGMPPASEWKPPAPEPSVVEGGRRNKRAAGTSASHALGAAPEDPHAGLDVEEGEERGGGDDDEPEAAGEADEDPHGGDEEKMTPRETVARGEIRAAGEATAVVKPGAILYVSATPVDPASGKPTGSAVAVERFEIKSLPMPFELAGASYQGEVVITAWTDADGEARTREPGDAEGRVRARLPAEGVDLVLDSVLK